MSIIEDAENLTPRGKTLCGIAFGAGVICLFILTAALGNIPSEFRKEWEKTKSIDILPSKPEEMVSPYGGASPKNAEERKTREQNIGEKLTRWQLELGSANIPAKTNGEVLLESVKSGLIHPNDARNARDEMLILGVD